MVRRSSKSPFMPDTLVFPGGRVDDEDGPEGSDEAFEQAARRECLEEASIELSDRALHWFDTWLTPSAEPRRYLARFFIARVATGEGQEAVADGHETHDGNWATAADFLARWEQSAVDLPPPTLSILMRLAQGNLGGLLDRNRDELIPPILPKVTAVGSELRILMPHHPAYANTDGEGGEVPPRSTEYPLGFTREEKRWRPWQD